MPKNTKLRAKYITGSLILVSLGVVCAIVLVVVKDILVGDYASVFLLVPALLLALVAAYCSIILLGK